MNMLIIEDERSLAESLQHLFEKENFLVDIVLDGKLGLEYAFKNIYDILIIDLMLSTLSGIEIIKELRKNNIKTPIIMLTARSELHDEINWLNCGADDYITKPFNYDRLNTRIKSLLRRNEYPDINTIRFKNLILYLDTCKLKENNKEIFLTSKEFHLMSLLMKNFNQMTSKEVIIEKIWVMILKENIILLKCIFHF